MFCICLGEAYSTSPRHNSHCNGCRQGDTAPRNFSLAHSCIIFSWFVINGLMKVCIGWLGKAVCLQETPVLVFLSCCSSFTQGSVLCYFPLSYEMRRAGKLWWGDEDLAWRRNVPINQNQNLCTSVWHQILSYRRRSERCPVNSNLSQVFPFLVTSVLSWKLSLAFPL